MGDFTVSDSIKCPSAVHGFLRSSHTKMAIIKVFLKESPSKCIDCSAHKILMPVFNLTYNRNCCIDLWYREEIDCNLNQMAQKIPLVNLSTRKIIFENNEHVIFPSGLSPPAQAHRGASPRAPCHLPLRETLFPGREMLLLHPGYGWTRGPTWPCSAGRQR